MSAPAIAKRFMRPSRLRSSRLHRRLDDFWRILHRLHSPGNGFYKGTRRPLARFSLHRRFGGYDDGTRNFVVVVGRADPGHHSALAVLRPLTAVELVAFETSGFVVRAAEPDFC